MTVLYIIACFFVLPYIYCVNSALLLVNFIASSLVIYPCCINLERSIFSVCIPLAAEDCIIAEIWCVFPSRIRFRIGIRTCQEFGCRYTVIPPPHGIRHWLMIPFKVPASWIRTWFWLSAGQASMIRSTVWLHLSYEV